MNKAWIALGLLPLALAAVPAQSPYKLVGRPAPPPREVLERLGLVAAWHARLPVHGQRDGIFSAQVIPGERVQLVVQTTGGLVALLDGETGDVVWRTQVGIPGWVTQPAGANSNSILVTRRHELHVLNRRSGYERVYSLDPASRQLTYGIPLVGLPSAPPVATDDAVYLSVSNRLVAYALPLFEALPKKAEAAAEPAKEKDEAENKEPVAVKPAAPKPEPARTDLAEEEAVRPTKSSLQPSFAWSYSVGDDAIQQPPLVGGNQVAVVTAGGEVISLNRFEGKVRGEPFRITSHISRRAGQYGALAYVGADDTYIYAINLEIGSLLWRHLAGAMLNHAPAVTDRDLFISPGREGLLRLDRDTGREYWRNRQAERFLAANQKYVYAVDRPGNFYVLDGYRGTTLAKYDLQEWNLPVPNELTDRVYVASRDGQILCLRHRLNSAPLAMKNPAASRRKVEEKGAEEKKAAEEPAPAEEKKAAPAKKEEEKKDEEKKEDKMSRAAPLRMESPAPAPLLRRGEPSSPAVATPVPPAWRRDGWIVS